MPPRTRRNHPKLVASVACLAIAAACTGGTEQQPQDEQARPLRGGVLRVALKDDVTAAMDPAREYYAVGWGLLRVMVRTLLSYPSAPAPEGNQLVPDLATSMPRVSDDRRTYTYTLRQDVRFGPPISRPVVCADFKAAFERLLVPDLGGYSFFYSVIEGAANFRPGDDLRGVECRDDSTLVFHLTQPAHDFAFRTALPATAPIPAAENVTEGHQRDYGRFLVSTGPYMWLGMEDVDFSKPNAPPPEGYEPDRSMVLVRNPEWDPRTDPVRKAYVDEIQVSIGGTVADLMNKVEVGDVDVVEDAPVPGHVLAAFQRSPARRDLISIHPSQGVQFMYMNTTLPPFDDVHVRKAVNLVVDKHALRRIQGGPAYGTLAGHLVPPSVPGGLPATYDPYRTPGGGGSVTMARDEMRRSRYDTDGDGLCDAPPCKDIFLATEATETYENQTASLVQDLRAIGITARIQSLDPSAVFEFYTTPAKKVQFGNAAGWGKDYPDAGTFIDPLLNGANIFEAGNYNFSQVDDPVLNKQIARCKPLVGEERGACWAAAEKYAMERIAPMVPYLWNNTIRVYSANLASLPPPFVQFTSGTAYDRVHLTQEAIEATKPMLHRP